MTDFERNLTIRIEKAAQQTLADKLGTVNWNEMPVDKMVKGTILTIFAWKLGVPAVLGVLRIIKWVFICIACAFLLGVCRIMTAPLPPGHVAGVDNPAPRAELVQPDENEYRAHHILHPAHR